MNRGITVCLLLMTAILPLDIFAARKASKSLTIKVVIPHDLDSRKEIIKNDLRCEAISNNTDLIITTEKIIKNGTEILLKTIVAK